jgi:4-hydroxybenzoate polyprenyltransferase
MNNPMVGYLAYGLLGFSVLYLLLKKPKFLRGAMMGIRPFRVIHYVGAAIIGVVIGYRMLGEVLGMPFEPWILINSTITIFFTFYASVMLNDFFDEEIDRISKKETPLVQNLLSPSQYRILGITTLVFSLLFAYSISYITFLIVIACHSISFIYSAPPLRLKRFFPFSTLLLALAAWFAILIGFSHYGGTKSLLIFPQRLTLLFLGGFTLTIPFKDIMDVRGDLRGGVHTLFTLFGEEKGKRLNSGLFILAYGLAPFILRFPYLILAAVPGGVLSVYFLLRKPFREFPVFLIYYAFMIILIVVLWYRMDLVLPAYS